MTRSEHPPDEYSGLDRGELDKRIAARRAELGGRLCILGHHYQRDEVLAHADVVGDSLRLSQMAARQRRAEYIVFCGVHFMAESAAVLCRPGQMVLLPNREAGCPMAAAAAAGDVRTALGEVGHLTRDAVMPVTYVNSTAGTKALTGSLGGVCCTSGNARSVFDWGLDANGGGAKKILAIPDEHLARNTAMALGYDENACVVYDPALPNGGLPAADVRRATFLLWKGHCYVHQRFTPEHVRAARRRHSDVIVMVHPECAREVVELADRTGSTEQIIHAVCESAPGSRWAIGTERHLVDRLAHRYPDRSIECLSPERPACLQMEQIDLPHLLWTLEGIVRGNPTGSVSLPRSLAADARAALRRMLELTSASDWTRQRKTETPHERHRSVNPSTLH